MSATLGVLQGELMHATGIGHHTGRPALARWGVRRSWQIPRMTKRACLVHGCPRYTTASRCDEHQRQHELARARDPLLTGRGARKRLPAATRRRALWLARYACQECHASQKQPGVRLVVHHVNEDANDHRMENLCVLCESCHRNHHQRGTLWV